MIKNEDMVQKKETPDVVDKKIRQLQYSQPENLNELRNQAFLLSKEMSAHARDTLIMHTIIILTLFMEFGSSLPIAKQTLPEAYFHFVKEYQAEIFLALCITVLFRVFYFTIRDMPLSEQKAKMNKKLGRLGFFTSTAYRNVSLSSVLHALGQTQYDDDLDLHEPTPRLKMRLTDDGELEEIEEIEKPKGTKRR